MTCLADMETILEETGLLTVPRMVRTTDASGNFLLQNVPTGPQIVFVDGASASTRQTVQLVDYRDPTPQLAAGS